MQTTRRKDNARCGEQRAARNVVLRDKQDTPLYHENAPLVKQNLAQLRTAESKARQSWLIAVATNAPLSHVWHLRRSYLLAQGRRYVAERGGA